MMVGVAVLAGSLGAILRHSMVTWLRSRRGSAAAVATVNLLGATAIGVVMGVAGTESLWHFAIVGFLGGFTTFSTLMSETIELVTRRDGRLSGWLYPLAQTVAGVALVAVGFMVARP